MFAEMTFIEFDKYFNEKLKNFATKDDLKKIEGKLDNFATKDDLKKIEGKLDNFATKDDLKNFATKDDLKNGLQAFKERMDYRFDQVDLRMARMKSELEFKIDQIDYKIDTSFDSITQSFEDLNCNPNRLEKELVEHKKKIIELDGFTSNHAIRLKKLEYKTS